jgi:hypothetical protein
MNDSLSKEPIKTDSPKAQSTPENPPNPPSITSTERRPEKEKKSKEAWKDLTIWEKFERVFKVVEATGLIAGFIVLIVVCKQLKAMQTQTTVMEGQFQAMTNQDNILTEQLDEMQKTRIQDERAWVYIEVPDNSLVQEGSNFVFNVTIKNTGKTPALITGGIMKAAIDISKIPQRDTETSGMGFVLVPNNTIRMPMPVPPLVIAYTGINPVYIYGTIWYKDISGDKHWTQFCYSITASGESTSQIPSHSLTDDMAQANEAQGTQNP